MIFKILLNTWRIILFPIHMTLLSGVGFIIFIGWGKRHAVRFLAENVLRFS